MRYWRLILITLGLPALALAERAHDITPDDYFSLAYPSSCALSPQGNYVAYTEGRWEEENDSRNTDLWIVETQSHKVRRLTFDPAGDGSARWDPTEAWIYFTSKRKRDDQEPPYNGKTQVWRVSPLGGDIQAVTRETDGVQHYTLSADGNTLYYTTTKKFFEEDEWKDLREEYQDLTFGHGVHNVSVLHKLDLETWRKEDLLDNDRFVVSMAVANDESRIALITRPSPKLITNEGWSTVDIYNTVADTVESLPDALWRDAAPSPYGWIIALGWSDDSQVLSFRVDFDGYPGEMFLAHFDSGNAPVVESLARPQEFHVEGGMKWMPKSRDLVLAVDDHARRRLVRIKNIHRGKHGGYQVMTPGDVVINDFSFNSRGDLAVLKPGMGHTPDLFLVDRPGKNPSYTRLTNLNPQVDTWELPQLQIVSWRSTDGTPVEGILELPPDYTPGDDPLPLVVSIHGGPTSSSHFAFRYWIYGRTIFAARGWALLDVNYRGSTGYGDKFLTDLIGNKNNLDVKDILSGVDALIERGIVDESRMAVMGWSNGGFLTDCIITTDSRFKAASSGAGVFDTVMQWSIEDTPGHVINFNRGLPWEQSESMHKASPLYNADKIKTPTVIHVGQNDQRVPKQHSMALHRAMHHYLHIPVELVIYPGTGHGLSKYSHRKAKLNWDIKWFDHYVLEKKEETETPS